MKPVKEVYTHNRKHGKEDFNHKILDIKLFNQSRDKDKERLSKLICHDSNANHLDIVGIELLKEEDVDYIFDIIAQNNHIHSLVLKRNSQIQANDASTKKTATILDDDSEEEQKPKFNLTTTLRDLQTRNPTPNWGQVLIQAEKEKLAALHNENAKDNEKKTWKDIKFTEQQLEKEVGLLDLLLHKRNIIFSYGTSEYHWGDLGILTTVEGSQRAIKDKIQGIIKAVSNKQQIAQEDIEYLQDNSETVEYFLQDPEGGKGETDLSKLLSQLEPINNLSKDLTPKTPVSTKDKNETTPAQLEVDKDQSQTNSLRNCILIGCAGIIGKLLLNKLASAFNIADVLTPNVTLACTASLTILAIAYNMKSNSTQTPPKQDL
jgi:hypothetical protein